MYWSPNLLAVVLQKQEISQHVVTRMQDLASEFSQIILGDTPDPHNGRGAFDILLRTRAAIWQFEASL